MLPTLVALGLVALYVPAYLMCVQPGAITGQFQGDHVTYDIQPAYRYVPTSMQPLFWPAHQVDRRIRNGRWLGQYALPAGVEMHGDFQTKPAPSLTIPPPPPGAL